MLRSACCRSRSHSVAAGAWKRMDRLDSSTANLLDGIVEWLDKLAQKNRFRTKGKTEYVMAYLSAFFFAKVIRTFKAFSILVKRGYTCEAEFLTRANFETVVDWLYIAQEPEERLARYMDYLEACRCRRLSTMDTLIHECGFEFPPVPTEKRDEIARLMRQFQTKYNLRRFPDSWSARSVRARARDVGLLSTYELAYRRQSELIHGGPDSHSSYLDFADDAVLGLKTDPDWEDWQWTISVGFLIVMCCLDAANEHLRLRADNVVNDLRMQFQEWTAGHTSEGAGEA